MHQQGYEVITASADGSEVEELKRREGVPHFTIDFTRTLSPFRDLKALFQLIRLIRSEKPDIVHTHTPKAGLLGMMAAKFCGVSVRMHTVAGMPLMEASGMLKHILTVTESITYACAHYVYPNSYQLKSWMDSHFKKYASKFRIIREGSSNGINTDYFSTTTVDNAEVQSVLKQYSIPSEASVFVFVGRIVEDKGIHELVEAFVAMESNAYLLLVGPFEDEREPVSKEIKTIIEEHPQIVHLGFQEDIRPFLATADIFVFPSYREGFPNVVLQAAAMELPCIVSDINGSNEIIEQEVNGLIVPVKDTEKLQAAMEQLQNDTDKRRLLASNARPSVLEKYDQNELWLALHDEYQLQLNK